MFRDALVKFYDLARRSDRVLFHIKTMADCFADQFPEKMIKADVVPASQPTKAFPNPVFSALPLPAFLNRFTYRLTGLGLRMWIKPIREFRQSVGLPERYRKPDLPSMYGISEYLLEKPDDFPGNSYFTGFWFDNSAAELSEDLAAFIAGGEAPLLITFGSMPFDSRVTVSGLISALSARLGIRIIVVKGWGLSHTTELEADPAVKVIDGAPYDRLFPLVKAIVHHGGIGTAAACLRAGKPFLACPVLHPFGDQFFWGKVACQKGVALYPQPLKELTVETFVTGVRKLLENPGLHAQAQEMAAKLSKENGIENAIRIIEGSALKPAH